MPQYTVYLGLGSNLGDRHQNLRRALRLLSEKMTIQMVSSIYETEPIGFSDQPVFLNAVCKATTSLSPEGLLLAAKEIEQEIGRTPTFQNGPRLIDIDILLYDNRIISTPDLEIPHPRMSERAFVLAPLAEIAPDLVHPIKGKRVSELIEAVSTTGVEKLSSTPEGSP